MLVIGCTAGISITSITSGRRSHWARQPLLLATLAILSAPAGFPGEIRHDDKRSQTPDAGVTWRRRSLARKAVTKQATSRETLGCARPV
jgi:hypothetical protein